MRAVNNNQDRSSDLSCSKIGLSFFTSDVVTVEIDSSKSGYESGK